MNFWLRYVGKIEDVRVYNISLLGVGECSYGMALPPFAIVVGVHNVPIAPLPPILMHEYGHFLQARKLGLLKFYLYVGIPSFLSAIRSTFFKPPLPHSNYWTEIWANQLSRAFFVREYWPESNYPSELPESLTKWQKNIVSN